MAERLVWLPTWHQARLVCRQLGISEEGFERRRQRNPGKTLAEELLEVYGLIMETLKIQ
jgi:hypothetical protein